MKSWPIPCLVLLSSAGCLSIDAVPVADERDAGTFHTIDAQVRDAAGDARSSEAAVPGDAEPSDAGIDGSMARACSPDVRASCTFAMEDTRGTASPPTVAGEYVYWTESGTTDANNNYHYDGAVVRVRIGTWLKEDVVTGLDFFDEVQRTFTRHTVLASEQYVVWGDINDSEVSYAALVDQPRTSHTLALPTILQRCRLELGQMFCAASRRGLDRDEDFAAISIDDAPYDAIFPAGAALYLQGPYNAVRFDLASDQHVVFAPAAMLIDALPDGRILARLADDRIGIAPLNGTMTPRWLAIAGPGEYLGARAGWVYTAAASNWQNGYHKPLNRVRADGSGATEVSDLPQDVQASWPGFPMRFPLAAAGLVLTRVTYQGAVKISAFEYITYPAD
jgi:hypothetical protein